MPKQFPKTSFPETLFVKQERDGEETFLIASADPGDLAERDVAVPAAEYKLVRAGVAILTEVKVK